MHNSRMKYTGVLSVLFMLISMTSYAQDRDAPSVRIVFDNNSDRIDIATGKQLPNYSQAERGSFQFYDKRLDAPTDHISYMFATMTSSDVKDIILLRKMHKQNVWAISGSGRILGLKEIIVADIVKEYAVSFIPLDPATKRPGSRVYVLLRDLYLIQWADLDHWAATKSQAEFESEKGIVY